MQNAALPASTGMAVGIIIMLSRMCHETEKISVMQKMTRHSVPWLQIFRRFPGTDL